MPAGLAISGFSYLLPEIVLTVAALVLLVADVFVPRRPRVLAGLALAGLAATALAIVPLAGVHTEIGPGLLAVDTFSLFFKGLFLAAAALTILMSVPYLETERAGVGEYYFLVLCATLGMMIMAAGIDLITAFIGLETMAVSFYVLAGFIKPNPRSNEAAVKYYLLGAFSLGILLYGMSLLYGLSGTTGLRSMAEALAGAATAAGPGAAGGGGALLVLAMMLVAAGLAFKIAAVPFHMWAPDVYEGAPTPITAFLSVGSKAASFAMLLRIFIEGLGAVSADWTALFWVLSALTMTVGNVAAITQSNVKRMLAYSSIAHAGYVLMGLVVHSERGITAMVVYLAAYAFMQLGAFAVIVLLHRHDLAGEDLKDFSGLSGRSPFAAFVMLVCLLSLGGVPPTAGFMGKLWLFGAAVQQGYYGLAVIGVLNSALSLYYYARLVVFMYLKRETTGSEPVLSPALAFTLASVLVLVVGLGVYPRALFDVAGASARALGASAVALAAR